MVRSHTFSYQSFFKTVTMKPYKKEYIVGNDRIKILLIQNDAYSSLDLFVNDRLSVSVRYSDFEKLVVDIERMEDLFERFLSNTGNETHETLVDKIEKLGYTK
jgi:hypothetical protein